MTQIYINILIKINVLLVQMFYCSVRRTDLWWVYYNSFKFI